jgi:hypothetical protein
MDESQWRVSASYDPLQRAVRVTQVVEHLPCKPQNCQKKEKKEKEKNKITDPLLDIYFCLDIDERF